MENMNYCQSMIQKFCGECGCKLEDKELKGEGMVPYCKNCGQYRFPMYNVAVSMIVVNESNGKILLIQQYGRQKNVLVAGYVNRGETEEEAVTREIKEETGMTANKIKFNRTKFYEPSNTLMCNFTVFVKDDSELMVNDEIDNYNWYYPEDARREILSGSLASEFLCTYLDEKNSIFFSTMSKKD